MPDGSHECNVILEQLREIRDMHIAHSSSVKTEIQFIKESIGKIEVIEKNIEAMRLADARQAGQIDGAVFALAKVGAAVMAVFAVVGWLATGGRWEWIKLNILK